MSAKTSLKFRYEEDDRDPAYNEVGLDEAGRGSLLGPVFAAAVVWDHVNQDGLSLKINDSKKLSPKKRRELADFIEKNAIAFGVGSVDSSGIDETNILAASMNAMHQALDMVYKKGCKPTHILVDGNYFVPYSLPGSSAIVRYTRIVNGDQQLVSIAAASILAKVHHDAWITDLLEREPEMARYKIQTNQGYGTKEHLQAIKEHGVTPYHRLTFKCCR